MYTGGAIAIGLDEARSMLEMAARLERGTGGNDSTESGRSGGLESSSPSSGGADDSRSPSSSRAEGGIDEGGGGPEGGPLGMARSAPGPLLSGRPFKLPREVRATKPGGSGASAFSASVEPELLWSGRLAFPIVVFPAVSRSGVRIPGPEHIGP